MKILELFSGYGTASFALKRLGIDYEIVGYSDIDKYANQCFQMNHGGKELGDIKQVNPNDLPNFDLLTGGFPCQAFSNAGKMQGELDPRGSLFYEIIRIAEVKQPKYMLLENVKGLTCKKFKDTFNKILSELDRIGYNVYWKVLNSKDYGIPQSRARVWFVCFRKDIDKKDFKFPEPVELKIFIKDILENEVDKKYYLSQDAINRLKDRCNLPNKKGIYGTLTANMYKINWNSPLIDKSRPSYLQFDFGNHSQEHRFYNPESLSPTLPTREIKILDVYNKKVKEDGICITLSDPCHNNLRLITHSLYPRTDTSGNGGHGHLTKDDGTAYCVDTGNMQAVEFNSTIRRLTPKECFRLMGFLNDEIKLDGLSDTQRYKLAGNGQDVNMVSLIFKEMLK